MRYTLQMLSVILLMSSLALKAQNPSSSQGQTERHAEHQEEGHKHFLGAFIGGTRLPHEHGFTLGAEYEFRPARRFGVGVTAEAIRGNANENVFVVLGYYHPTEALALFAGGGWDRRLKVEAEAGHEGAPHDDSDELRGRRALARVGIGYEVPVGAKALVIPNVSLDFAGGEAILVFGLTVGFGF